MVIDEIGDKAPLSVRLFVARHGVSMEEDVLDEEEVILYDLLTPHQWPESISIEVCCLPVDIV